VVERTPPAPPEPPAVSEAEPDEQVEPGVEPLDAAALDFREGLNDVLAAIASVRETGARVERRLAELQSSVDRESRAEAAREKVIDRLHSELQDYKQDLLLNTLRPVFIDLIQLHDDIGKVAVLPAAGQGEAADEARKWVGLLEGFQTGIEDVLYRQGVEPFTVEEDTFDPRRQRAVTPVPTEDESLNKKVAARLRKGFRAGDRVIRPEIVSVYAFKKEAPGGG
jgi:molecular chaperone GrpE